MSFEHCASLLGGYFLISVVCSVLYFGSVLWQVRGCMFGYAAIASLCIFAVTLYLMVKRPWGLKLGFAASIGALASLLLGTVSVDQAFQSFAEIWDAALAFIGIVTLSVVLDAMGFFKWAAMEVVKLAGGSGVKLYFYVSLLTATVSIFFANDSAVLILTPIVLEIVSQLKVDSKGRLAYLFSAGLIADTAAMPLITSNPINIVSADYFKYSFIDHFIVMAPVAAATVLTSLAVVYLFFRKDIPKTYSAKLVHALSDGSQFITSRLLKLSVGTLLAVDVGYVIASLNRLPVSLVICSGALFLVAAYWFCLRNGYPINEERKGLKVIAAEINWDILLFMVSIFIVVQGLKHTGIVDYLATLFVQASLLPPLLSVMVTAYLVTVGASFMNNWPMTLLGLVSIRHAVTVAGLTSPAKTMLVFSNIIGNNLGPHFFPLGSLAILMWLETMRRKGVNIRLRDYLRVGSVLSIIEVAVASVALWLVLGLTGFELST